MLQTLIFSSKVCCVCFYTEAYTMHSSCQIQRAPGMLPQIRISETFLSAWGSFICLPSLVSLRSTEYSLLHVYSTEILFSPRSQGFRLYWVNSLLTWTKHRAWLFISEEKKNKINHVFWADDSKQQTVIHRRASGYVWTILRKEVWSASLRITFSLHAAFSVVLTGLYLK